MKHQAQYHSTGRGPGVLAPSWGPGCRWEGWGRAWNCRRFKVKIKAFPSKALTLSFPPTCT